MLGEYRWLDGVLCGEQGGVEGRTFLLGFRAATTEDEARAFCDAQGWSGRLEPGRETSVWLLRGATGTVVGTRTAGGSGA